MFHIAPNQMALYVHWPFCKSKCPYCDFNSHVASSIDHSEWARAYEKEIAHYAAKLPNREISSIFFGGGTPSLMHPETVAVVINAAQKYWKFSDEIEITLEANPTSVEAEKFAAFKAAGVNRLSLGIQSLDESDLKFLGREHNALEAKKAIETAAQTFENYSFDLIYARPGQTTQSWKKELETALTLAAKHISLYQLTIEKGTPFFTQYAEKKFALPEEEASTRLYEMTAEIVGRKGMRAYEISNYALSGYESKHNLAYWQYGEYLGIGPGAHSRLRAKSHSRRAMVMVHRPDLWLQAVAEKNHGLQSEELIEGNELIAELLMMGLRLESGISREIFKRETGVSIEAALPKKPLEDLISDGLMALDDHTLRATDRGRLLLNSVIEKLTNP